MAQDRFGEGLFGDRPREEPRRDGDRRGENHPRDADDWDDSVDENGGPPWIGVHVLTQFVFCPRAGMLAYEQNRQDEGSDPGRPPKLDYLPDYLPEIIGEELNRVRRDLWTFATYASIILTAIVLVAYFQPILGGMLLVACLVFAPWVCRHVRVYLILRGRQRLSLRATGRGPDPNITASQIINWWDMLKADYEPTKPRDPHRDRSLRLSGKPYLILTHKGKRIPVIRKWTGKEELHRKDYARCGAYAHLIETCEQTTVPFAVILFGKGYDGVTVPITASVKKAFRDGLDRTRHILEQVASGDLKPAKPESDRFCSGCDFGRPRLYRPGKSITILGDARLAAKCTNARNEKPYHCTCGDRFEEGVPPHKLAIALGLTD